MTASDPSAAAPLHELIARRAGSCADALAVVDGERELTYGELDRGANRLAHLLLRAGAGPHAPVGVCLHRGVHLAVALLAVWKAGAAYVPLDPGHPRARTAAVLADTGATVVVTEAELRGADRRDRAAHRHPGPRADRPRRPARHRPGRPGDRSAPRLRAVHLRLHRPPQGRGGHPCGHRQPGGLAGTYPRTGPRRPGPAQDAAHLRRRRLGDLRAAGQRRHRGDGPGRRGARPRPAGDVGRSPPRHGAAGRSLRAADAGRRAGVGGLPHAADPARRAASSCTPSWSSAS